MLTFPSRRMRLIRELVCLPSEPGDAIGEGHRELLLERVVFDGAGAMNRTVKSRKSGSCCGSCVVHHAWASNVENEAKIERLFWRVVPSKVVGPSSHSRPQRSG